MSGAGVGVTTVRSVTGEVVDAIRANAHEFTGGLDKVTLNVFINNSGAARIVVQRPRILAGASEKERNAVPLLPGEIDTLAATVRSKLLAAAPASGLPKQFIIDIFLRGPRPHVEVTTKA